MRFHPTAPLLGLKGFCDVVHALRFESLDLVPRSSRPLRKITGIRSVYGLLSGGGKLRTRRDPAAGSEADQFGGSASANISAVLPSGAPSLVAFLEMVERDRVCRALDHTTTSSYFRIVWHSLIHHILRWPIVTIQIMASRTISVNITH